MTKNPDTRLMPAHNLIDLRLTTGTDGEGVKTVALFESRKARKRDWDELSEIDRAVLLESVRQRRDNQERQSAIETEIYRMRINR